MLTPARLLPLRVKACPDESKGWLLWTCHACPGYCDPWERFPKYLPPHRYCTNSLKVSGMVNVCRRKGIKTPNTYMAQWKHALCHRSIYKNFRSCFAILGSSWVSSTCPISAWVIFSFNFHSITMTQLSQQMPKAGEVLNRIYDNVQPPCYQGDLSSNP